ncbi:hypothetical protein EDD29_5118 [Actinocorallia herbida]|uniref:Uncharacterized protein n=1 Tax=Actinocorallia herbida TaxID=58109 RepID=A0A3N1D1Z6_9ACTN|nr:hypothetical protein [Actinocorallia herbida]ROO87510.1 hypothetical protein EDD29_5118 [Actinocorallia herbida]
MTTSSSAADAVVAGREPGRGQDSEPSSPPVDHGAIRHRLITMRRSIGQLRSLGPVDTVRWDLDPATGLVVERILSLLLDQAFMINRHVAEAVLGEAPRTAAGSFEAAQRAGLIDLSLVAAIVPPDGPHHVLMQLHLDSDPTQIAAIVAAALHEYQEYVRQITRWTAV